MARRAHIRAPRRRNGSTELTANPVRRAGQSDADCTSATIRSGSSDDAMWVSVVAFSEGTERLLALVKGDRVSAAGRAELSSWTGRDGVERHGLRIRRRDRRRPPPPAIQ
jgi:single-stranded DNA-binding protein